MEDTRGMLANTVLAHVPVVHFNFKMKVMKAEGLVDNFRDVLTNTVLSL